MDGARKNARLRRSSPGFLDADASRVDSELLEEVDQLESFGIIAHNADWQRHAPERVQVVHGVCSAAGNELRLALIQDQHRGFARDARNFAVDEDIRDEVSQERPRGGP